MALNPKQPTNLELIVIFESLNSWMASDQ